MPLVNISHYVIKQPIYFVKTSFLLLCSFACLVVHCWPSVVFRYNEVILLLGCFTFGIYCSFFNFIHLAPLAENCGVENV